ncbi:MAG: YgiQ family radical SAM protein [Candidatus Cloacimonadota bacterium]|nr:MAG: YgiQ family radical SAM protein [Candidatus Cloacimonadota bacterium]PIE78801.1 MAG: YgiQ family radical SAM protein [Candidatus Delongbacteria bacterium]
MNIDEMKALNWDYLDIVLLTGDAYIDHPSFGTAIIGNVLLSKGFKVGVIAAPDIESDDDFLKLPKPKLFFGITSGNVDSMINNYTAMKKYRSDDVYREKGSTIRRPDRAVIIYTNIIKKLFKGSITLLGGVEASLRRFPHFDYWQEKVRNSILFDSKADYLIYGQGEKPVIEFAEAVKNNDFESIKTIKNLAWIKKESEELPQSYKYITLPDVKDILKDKNKYSDFIKTTHQNSNPYLECGFVQKFDSRSLVVNPPILPLNKDEMDSYYDLDYENKPHPIYKNHIPAYEMIRNSITIHRGCFGGCSFCAIGQHQGKFIQSRSEKSILREVKRHKGKTITDLGGPSANMYDMGGIDKSICKKCRRPSCVFPNICPNLNSSHKHILELYRKSSKYKKIFINSGIRHELALEDPKYIEEIAKKYTSGLLKIAPEHTVDKVLKYMYKPPIKYYEKFKEIFEKASTKEQYVLPYLISSFPGCSENDMVKMMNYLKENKIRIDQVQDFIPSPSVIAASMYYTGKDPISGEELYIPKGDKIRKLHRSMMQYFKPENRNILNSEKVDKNKSFRKKRRKKKK